MKTIKFIFIVFIFSSCYEDKTKAVETKIIPRGKILRYNYNFELNKFIFFNPIIFNGFILQKSNLQINDSAGSIKIEAKNSGGAVCNLKFPLTNPTVSNARNLIQNVNVCEKQGETACILIGYPFINLSYLTDDIMNILSLTQSAPSCNGTYNCNSNDYTYLDNLITVESEKLLRQCQ